MEEAVVLTSTDEPFVVVFISVEASSMWVSLECGAHESDLLRSVVEDAVVLVVLLAEMEWTSSTGTFSTSSRYEFSLYSITTWITLYEK